MSKIILLLTLLFFPLQICYAQDQSETANQEKTSAQEKIPDSYTWDFGQVKEGGVSKHNFILENGSGKTLTIKDVNTSCGCTVSKVEKKILLPGEATTISVQFISKGYSGAVKKYVYVHTDSLDNPILRFIIKADVVK